MKMTAEMPAEGDTTPFDRLMRGLIAVPKSEVEAEEAKYRKRRDKAGQVKGRPPKPKK